jgi:hypothetical protein
MLQVLDVNVGVSLDLAQREVVPIGYEQSQFRELLWPQRDQSVSVAFWKRGAADNLKVQTMLAMEVRPRTGNLLKPRLRRTGQDLSNVDVAGRPFEAVVLRDGEPADAVELEDV